MVALEPVALICWEEAVLFMCELDKLKFGVFSTL